MNVVTRDAFAALLQKHGSLDFQKQLSRFDLDMILGRGECTVHEGNLITSGDWRRAIDNILVLGSISCDGLIDISTDDRGVSGDWGGSLWTLGNVRCRNLAGHYGASVIVDGSLIVDELTVAAFEDSMLWVTGDFSTRFFFGMDIWAEVGGRVDIEYGDGYALPIGYHNAAAQVIKPRHDRKSSQALLNLEDQGVDDLVAKLRRAEHFRVRSGV